MTLPEAKTRVQCRPSKALRTLIRPQHFTTWMIIVKYLCFNRGQKARICSMMWSWIYTVIIFSIARGESIESRDMTPRSASEADLIKATRRPVLQSRPFGRHKERPDTSALGGHDGSDMFDITFCHPLPPARVRDGMANALNLLTKAWDEKIRRSGRVLDESLMAVKLFPMPLSTLGGWHPD